MKSKVIAVLFSVFFVLFLLLGIKTSQSLFGGEDTSSSDLVWKVTPDKLEIQEQPPSMDSFTLLIYVDDLTVQEPALQGVWLSRSGEEPQSKYFFPIFPSQAEDGVTRDEALQTAFWLDARKVPMKGFFDELSNRNLSWQRVLLVDRFLIQQLGEPLSTGADSGQVDVSGLLAGTEYQTENRLEAQKQQAQLIEKICRLIPQADQGDLYSRLGAGFSGHLVLYGTAADEFSLLWQGVSRCSFPTLSSVTE